ncbi:MAG: LLM class flavin-dependent oxidoreductase [Pseudonocardiaceae bacterium]|nr:LLM class flavin-dependent oxidoreductase [Pseudonocardiaceae bacterium]
MAVLGLSLATRAGRSGEEFGELARQAEQAGFTAVFLAEGGSDVLSLCPPVVAATSRVAVGTAIANAYLHPPVLTAMTAATLDDAAGGRFVLGLGTANARLNHDLLGLPRMPPLRMVEEYVALVRATLAQQTFSGEFFGLGDPLVLDRPPHRTRLPIQLAALQPRMLELAGRVADGVILNLSSPEQVARAVTTVGRAAESAGRDPGSVPITCVLQCCLSDDPEQARAAARGVVLHYARHPSAARLFTEHDPHDRLAVARAALSAGDREAAAAAVPQQVADAFVVHGDAAACRDRLRDYRSAGIDLPVVFPMPVSGRWDGAAETAIAAFGDDLAEATNTRNRPS